MEYNFEGILFKHSDTDINIWEESSIDETGLCRWMFSIASYLSNDFAQLPIGKGVKVRINIVSEHEEE